MHKLVVRSSIGDVLSKWNCMLVSLVAIVCCRVVGSTLVHYSRWVRSIESQTGILVV